MTKELIPPINGCDTRKISQFFCSPVSSFVKWTAFVDGKVAWKTGGDVTTASLPLCLARWEKSVDGVVVVMMNSGWAYSKYVTQENEVLCASKGKFYLQSKNGDQHI